jgi:hypothetical protein
LWRYDPTETAWVQVKHKADSPTVIEAVTLAMSSPKTDQTLFALPETITLFWLEWSEDDRKSNGFAVSGPVLCNDIAIGEPPKGMIATCVPFKDHATAMFVPDPEIHCRE